MHPRILEVTERLIARSRPTRERYLQLIRGAASDGLAGALTACWPLHPLVATLLGSISRRRFGQSQRNSAGSRSQVHDPHRPHLPLHRLEVGQHRVDELGGPHDRHERDDRRPHAASADRAVRARQGQARDPTAPDRRPRPPRPHLGVVGASGPVVEPSAASAGAGGSTRLAAPHRRRRRCARRA